MKNLSSNVVGIICLPGWDRLTDLPKSGDTPGLTGLSRLVEGFLIKWRISTVILPIWMISFHLASWWLIDLYIKIGFSVRLFQSLNHQEVNLKVWLLFKSSYHILPNHSTSTTLLFCNPLKDVRLVVRQNDNLVKCLPCSAKLHARDTWPIFHALTILEFMSRFGRPK